MLRFVWLSVCVLVYICLSVFGWQNRESVVRALSRAPMLWTSDVHAGFTAARSPWLPVHPLYRTANVEVIFSLFLLY